MLSTFGLAPNNKPATKFLCFAVFWLCINAQILFAQPSAGMIEKAADRWNGLCAELDCETVPNGFVVVFGFGDRLVFPLPATTGEEAKPWRSYIQHLEYRDLMVNEDQSVQLLRGVLGFDPRQEDQAKVVVFSPGFARTFDWFNVEMTDEVRAALAIAWGRFGHPAADIHDLTGIDRGVFKPDQALRTWLAGQGRVPVTGTFDLIYPPVTPSRLTLVSRPGSDTIIAQCDRSECRAVLVPDEINVENPAYYLDWLTIDLSRNCRDFHLRDFQNCPEFERRLETLEDAMFAFRALVDRAKTNH